MLLETLQKLLRTGELAPPQLNDQNRKLFHLPSVMVQREAFIASREFAGDQAKWDALRRSQRLHRHLEG